MFRSDRIVEVLPGKRSFRPQRVALLRRYLAQLEEERATKVAAVSAISRYAETIEGAID